MNRRLYTAVFYSLLYLLIPFLFWDGFGVFELNFFAIGTYIISSLSLGYLCSTREIKTISSSFWIFVYIFLMIAPVSQQLAGYYPWPGYYQDYHLMYSWALVFLCNVSFAFFSIKKFKSIPTPFHYEFSHNKMRYFIVFSVFTTVFSIFWIGGFSSVFLSRDEFSEIFNDNITASMVIQAMFRIPFFILSLYYLKLFLSSRIKNSEGRSNLFKFLIFFGLTVILNNPLSTPRFWVACIFITYLLTITACYKMNVNKTYINLLVFLTIFIFPVSDAYRRTVDVSISDYFSETNISDGFVNSPNYDSFQQITNSFVYVENNGITYGGRTLSTLLFWVPRAVFPAKFLSSGEDIAVYFRYEYTNLSAPLWAEMYLDFGFVGALLIFGLLGKLVRYLDDSSTINSNIVVFFIAAYGIYFFRGTLLSVVGFLVVTMILFLLIKRSRQTGTHSE